MRESGCQINRTHNPFEETHWVSRLRENLTSGSYGEGLETDQDCLTPRQSFTRQLFFRDIKTTMGMDVLRCRTPEMARKEVLMHFIAYNCVRRLMYEAAEEADIDVRIVSFKGSLQALRSWEPHLNHAKISRAERFRLISDLYDAMTNMPIKQRPGRSEPRCVNRRPKNYQRMTSPRHEMKVIPHRSKYLAATP